MSADRANCSRSITLHSSSDTSHVSLRHGTPREWSPFDSSVIVVQTHFSTHGCISCSARLSTSFVTERVKSLLSIDTMAIVCSNARDTGYPNLECRPQLYQPNAVLFGDSLRTGIRQISGLLFPDPASRPSRLVCQVHSGAN